MQSVTSSLPQPCGGGAPIPHQFPHSHRPGTCWAPQHEGTLICEIERTCAQALEAIRALSNLSTHQQRQQEQKPPQQQQGHHHQQQGQQQHQLQQQQLHSQQQQQQQPQHPWQPQQQVQPGLQTPCAQEEEMRPSPLIHIQFALPQRQHFQLHPQSCSTSTEHVEAGNLPWAPWASTTKLDDASCQLLKHLLVTLQPLSCSSPELSVKQELLSRSERPCAPPTGDPLSNKPDPQAEEALPKAELSPEIQPLPESEPFPKEAFSPREQLRPGCEAACTAAVSAAGLCSAEPCLRANACPNVEPHHETEPLPHCTDPPPSPSHRPLQKPFPLNSRCSLAACNSQSLSSCPSPPALCPTSSWGSVLSPDLSAQTAEAPGATPGALQQNIKLASGQKRPASPLGAVEVKDEERWEEASQSKHPLSPSKKERRLASNRASAKRARIRRHERTKELEELTSKLQKDRDDMDRRLTGALGQLQAAASLNSKLKEKIASLRSAVLEGQCGTNCTSNGSGDACRAQHSSRCMEQERSGDCTAMQDAKDMAPAGMPPVEDSCVLAVPGALRHPSADEGIDIPELTSLCFEFECEALAQLT